VPVGGERGGAGCVIKKLHLQVIKKSSERERAGGEWRKRGNRKILGHYTEENQIGCKTEKPNFCPERGGRLRGKKLEKRQEEKGVEKGDFS